jgi:hypothetical protein
VKKPKYGISTPDLRVWPQKKHRKKIDFSFVSRNHLKTMPASFHIHPNFVALPLGRFFFAIKKADPIWISPAYYTLKDYHLCRKHSLMKIGMQSSGSF